MIASWRAQRYASHAGLAVVVVISAVMNTHNLAQNGYGNIFYSAGVHSMLRSWHNFVFVSFDPGGLVSVDKPPLALWLQATSARLFGFTPLSLLIPEAVAGTLAVALLYMIVARRMGAIAAFAAALALAVYPSFVAVSRDNGVDPLLILLMVIACGLALRAAETGRLKALLGCALAVGLAFNVKTLAALLVVPGIVAAYAACAPGSLRRRGAQLLAAGAVMLVVSFAWIAFVELTPASQRPYVGSSTDNTELGLTFEYNGVGRVEGQSGGPGQTKVLPGGYVPASRQRAVNDARRAAAVSGSAAARESTAAAAHRHVERALAPERGKGRETHPIPFGGPPRPLRLFGVGLGDQAAWLLPFALLGLLGLGMWLLIDRATQAHERREDSATSTASAPGWRRDRRLAMTLVLGGWFAVEALVLSLSKGIVHPYYVSALAPGTAAMAGAGAVALTALMQRSAQTRRTGLALMTIAVTTTVAAQIVLMHREHFMRWFVPVLAIAAALGLCALLARRALAAPATAATFLVLLVAPAAYATTTWLAPVQGTFPVAGQSHDAGDGGYGVNPRDIAVDRALMSYVRAHRPGSRWALLTVAAETASPMMLMGLDAGAVAGYSGSDPTLDGAGLARLVARGQARYVLLGGEYSLRGGNRATAAVLRSCRELAPFEWHSPIAYPLGLVLFDCAGRERALAAAG